MKDWKIPEYNNNENKQARSVKFSWLGLFICQ